MAYLGQAWLHPCAAYILWVARQRIPGLLLLRGAAPRKSAGLEPQARMVSLLYLEFCGSASRMGIGCRRFQSAVGVGGVSARRRRFRRPRLHSDVLRVCPAIR